MSSELKKASAGGKFWGSIALFLVFALLFGIGYIIHQCFPGDEKGLDAKRAEARAEKLDALKKDNEQKLTTYAWVNKDKGIVQIPIDQAMKIVAPVLAGKSVAPSAVKVEDPYPYGLQDAPAVPAPAASGSAAPGSPSTSGSTQPQPSPATSGSAAAPAPAATPAAATPAPTPAQ